MFIQFLHDNFRKNSICLFVLLASALLQSIVFAQSSAQTINLNESDAINSTIPNMIELIGEATLNIVPDELSFTLVIEKTDDTMSLAYRHVEQQLSQVLKLLQAFELPDSQIQAMDFSMTTLFDYQNNKKIIGYSAQRTVSVTLKSISDYGDIIQLLSNAGNYRFEQLKLSSSNYLSLEKKALAAAYQNAVEKAQAIFLASDNTLLGLIHLREANIVSHRPLSLRSVSLNSGTDNFSEGSISITKRVVAHFEFN